MAENAKQVGIKNSWSLLTFAKAHGKMQLGSFTNQLTGENFRSCIFTDPETEARTFVNFSSNMGELSADQIKAQKDDLQVVELESGNFSLCQKGANSWEDVELF